MTSMTSRRTSTDALHRVEKFASVHLDSKVEERQPHQLCGGVQIVNMQGHRAPQEVFGDTAFRHHR
eukprot:CAMPEP_0178409302 /NCGR_PEP_ID=MMETSP0689_2-20121128/20393_1 /TAXON_ID=160604 /ORGANISM="Amphidinium massartii, Strain CS-259" /LENGTH=65 /DNA_ID=CAMNT_0020030441 /DNA_START=583 /DNA_END=780 /DNA_ORIENTATION=-